MKTPAGARDSRDARAILGPLLVSCEDVENAWGICYSLEQKLTHGLTIPSPEALCWMRENKIAFIALPPSPRSLYEMASLDRSCFGETMLSRGVQPFLREERTPSVNWLLIKAVPVASSARKTWVGQEALIKSALTLAETSPSDRLNPLPDDVLRAVRSGDERVPNIAEAGWAGATLSKLGRNPPFADGNLYRVSTCDADGQHLAVCVRDGRFEVLNREDNWTYPDVVLSSAPAVRILHFAH